MKLLKEYLEIENLNYDIEHLRKQVISVVYLNYRKHFKEVLFKWYVETTKQPQLTILNDKRFFSYLNVSAQIPYLIYSPEDSVKYEREGKIQYRLSFVPQDRIGKTSYKEYESMSLEKNGNIITIYQPLLISTSNITNNIMNSVSIYTVVNIENIPGIVGPYNCEFVTRISNMDFMVKLNDGSYIKETFQKYINKKIDVDYNLETIKKIVVSRINNFRDEIENDFNNSVNSNSLYFMSGFSLFGHIDFNKSINNMNYNHDKSTIRKTTFDNYSEFKSLKPIFQFHNGTQMHPPLIRLDVIKNQDGTNSFILNITINFINIPTTEKYYLDTTNDKYIYTYNKKWDEKEWVDIED